MPNAPHWGWYIILYFFLGGLASGLFVVGTLAALNGDPRDRPITRFAYLAAFPLVITCAFLLTIDLGKPLRFWHMLFQSERIPMPMLKYWAPMSLGSWVVAIFGAFTAFAFLAALVDSGRLTNDRAVRAVAWARARPRPLRIVWTALALFFALFFGGYTGVLLVGTNVPLWQHAQILGAVFLLSAASTAYALLILGLRRQDESAHAFSVGRLIAADRWIIVLELIAIAIMLITLGRFARPLITGLFGVVFWLGVVGLGLVIPLVLPRISRIRGNIDRVALGAGCVLVGGLLLRFAVIMAPQWPNVALWAL
ncbi:MAG TPA: NrfD/PsrC family molybdoenzyme membrane anchor subunit [Gemmatimonadaceae bacterium]|nr:NrfD/PsrC family molybdoenzyme membrane anchor subunit [Gemmatimonadaceae bacterium]